MSWNAAQYDAGADVRFALAYERLGPGDEARSRLLSERCGIPDADEEAEEVVGSGPPCAC